MIDKKKKAFTIAILRRGSFRWRPRSEAAKAAKIARNQYKCKMCGVKKTYTRSDGNLDHIHPVVNPTTGFTTFDDYIDRLYCSVNDFQWLCHAHHDLKTAQEKGIRKQTKEDAKKEQRHKDVEALEKMLRGEKRKRKPKQ